MLHTRRRELPRKDQQGPETWHRYHFIEPPTKPVEQVRITHSSGGEGMRPRPHSWGGDSSTQGSPPRLWQRCPVTQLLWGLTLWSSGD